MNKLNNNDNQKFYKVGIYLRLSNEDKDKINKNNPSESIKNQRNMLLDYINKHQELILIDEYCDEDLSGAGTYRPEFERLISDCEKRKLDIVLCKSQSRFSRDMEIVERYINNKFKEWNIRFIGLADNADTENYGNKKSRQINGLVNEWYLEDVSNNIRSAFNSKMKEGEFISPFAAFGYEISKENNNKLIIDPFASDIVKEIYNLYLKGFGYTKIVKYLNDKNIPSPSLYKYQKNIKLNIVSNKPRESIKWNPNTIKTILTNELYIGNLIQGKRTTVSYKNHKIINKPKNKWIKKENTHAAIIDKNIFDKVQLEIKKRTKPLKSTGLVHSFSGKVFCLECKNHLRKKNSSKHEYLVCSHINDNYINCLNKSSIRYDVLEKIILNLINKKIKDYFDLNMLKKNYFNNSKNSFSKKLESLKKQKKDIIKKINSNNKYLKNIYEDKVNKVISLKEFKDLITIYKNDIQKLNSELNFIKKEISYYETKKHFDPYKLFNKYYQLKKLNRFIVNEFIDKIFIGQIYEKTNTRNIEIIWNF